jgi:DNA-binding NarL/FixJ family response regulator
MQGLAMKGNILIIDDHPLIVKGLGYFLIHYGYHVSGIYSNKQDIYEALYRDEPDIIILDVHMPDMNGMDILNVIKTLDIKSKVIIYTGTSNHLHARDFARAGASAYVHKSESLEVLMEAIEVVRNTEGFYSTERKYRITNELFFDDASVTASLTSREMETLILLAKGLSVKKISEELNLSNKTISNYKCKILEKFQTKNLLEVIDRVRTSLGV